MSLMPFDLHLRVHEWFDGTLVISVDMFRHMRNLPSQRDILEELLGQPIPLPELHVPDELDELLLQPVPFAVGVPVSPTPCLLDSSASESPTSASSPSPTDFQHDLRTRFRMHHTLLTDAMILKFVLVHGPRWRKLARCLGGRILGYTDDVVRNRYIRIMEAQGTPYTPKYNHPKDRKKPGRPCKPWSAEEDELIYRLMLKNGRHWIRYEEAFGNTRTLQAIRNRANRLGLAERLLNRRGSMVHKEPDAATQTQNPAQVHANP